MEKHKLIIKWRDSKQVINSLKIKELKDYLPTTEELIGHIGFQKLKVKKGIGPSPLEITVPEELKSGIRKELSLKGYKGNLDEVAMFASVESTIPVCVLFL